VTIDLLKQLDSDARSMLDGELRHFAKTLRCGRPTACWWLPWSELLRAYLSASL